MVSFVLLKPLYPNIALPFRYLLMRKRGAPMKSMLFRFGVSSCVIVKSMHFSDYPLASYIFMRVVKMVSFVLLKPLFPNIALPFRYGLMRKRGPSRNVSAYSCQAGFAVSLRLMYGLRFIIIYFSLNHSCSSRMVVV